MAFGSHISHDLNDYKNGNFLPYPVTNVVAKSLQWRASTSMFKSKVMGKFMSTWRRASALITHYHYSHSSCLVMPCYDFTVLIQSL